MTCANCGQEIPKARQLALPGETWCVSCVEADGDVDRIQGAMVWDHKTAPTLVMGREAEIVRKYSRRGFHASLPLGSYENPRLQASRRAQQELQDVKIILQEKPDPSEEFEIAGIDGTSVLPAHCHPDRPKVSPDGKCLECAIAWYGR